MEAVPILLSNHEGRSVIMSAKLDDVRAIAVLSNIFDHSLKCPEIFPDIYRYDEYLRLGWKGKLFLLKKGFLFF